MKPQTVAPYQHAHLPTYPLFDRELHPYLRNIYRVGGGRIARIRVGGLGDAICMVENALYPYLLYLHWGSEFRWFVPARLRTNWDGSIDTVPVVHLADVREFLPSLERAHLQAFRQPLPAA